MENSVIRPITPPPPRVAAGPPAVQTRPWYTDSICNVAAALSWQARCRPDAVAVRLPGRSLLRRKLHYSDITYRELDELSDHYARGLLAQGITAGSRTALMLPAGLDYIALLFALLKAGAPIVLIDPGLDRKARAHCLEEAAPDALIGSGGISPARLRSQGTGTDPVMHPAKPDDLAALLFIAGGTGAPRLHPSFGRGVVCRHRHLVAEVEIARATFGIESGEIGLTTFPPLALLDPALGVTTVVPDRDPANLHLSSGRRGAAGLQNLVEVIEHNQVTTLCATPACLDSLSRHTAGQGTRLWSIRRVISVGARLPLEVVRRLETSLANDATIHVPWGAAGCQPVSNVTNRELDAKAERLIESGEGIPAGRPVSGSEVRVIRISDDVIANIGAATTLPPGMPGEIVVRSPACAEDFRADEGSAAMSRIADGMGDAWLRTGDAGILDGQGRLWLCGRVAERVETGQETLFAGQAEAVFNQHPDAVRTALVGVGPPGRQIPVLCVELGGHLAAAERERTHYDLLQLAQSCAPTRAIRTVLFHTGFPAAVRNSTEIDRAELTRWAARQLQR